MKYYYVPVRNQNRIAEDIKKKLQLKKTDKLLEVGCGFGYLLKRLKGDVKETVGCDIDDMSKYIENFVQCPANKLSFKDNEFDKVFMHSVSQYFPDYRYAKDVEKELKRVCITNGLIYICDVDGRKITLFQKIWRLFKKKEKTHLVFEKNFFKGKISYPSIRNYGLSRLSRFNILMKK